MKATNLTAAQKKVLKAYQDLPHREFVGTGGTYKVLGKLAHPNTLDSLVKKGYLQSTRQARLLGLGTFNWYGHRAID